MNSKNIKISFDKFQVFCNYDETIKSDGDKLIDDLIGMLNSHIKEMGYLNTAGETVLISRSNVEQMFKIRIDDTWEKNFLSLKNCGILKNEANQHEVDICLLTDNRVFFEPTTTLTAGKKNATDYCYLNNSPMVQMVVKWNGEMPQTTATNLMSETKFININPVTSYDEMSSLAIDQINKLVFENKKYTYPATCSHDITPNQVTCATSTFKTSVKMCSLNDNQFFSATVFNPQNPLHLLPPCSPDFILTNRIDDIHGQSDKAVENMAQIRRRLKVCDDYLKKQCTMSDREIIEYLDLTVSMSQNKNCLDKCIEIETEKLTNRGLIENLKYKTYSKLDADQYYLAKMQFFQVPKPDFNSKKGGYLKLKLKEIEQLGLFINHENFFHTKNL